MNTKRYLSVLLGALAFAPMAIVHAQPDLIEQLQCAECHGQGGASTQERIPILSGASDFFLENQLFQFQESERPCAESAFDAADGISAADHCELLGTLSEDDFADIAMYYTEQPKVAADQPVDEALAAIGGGIHEASCDRCHSEGGSLALDDAGILAGQWKAYLVSSMQEFHAGLRWQEERMQEEMAPLGDDDFRALAEYYAQQGEQRFR